MEYLLGGIFFVVLPLVIVIGIAYLAVRWFRQDETRRKAEAEGDVVDSLRYHVPTAQDPAAVIAALTMDGYEAVLDDNPATRDVLILTPHGADRERARVRAVIAHDAALNTQGDRVDVEKEIRFADE